MADGQPGASTTSASPSLPSLASSSSSTAARAPQVICAASPPPHSAAEETDTAMGRPPHALLLPLPLLGHAAPLMELSHRLLQLGFAITFVTTEHTHHLLPEPAAESDRLRLVAIPDGLPPEDDRANPGRLIAAILRAMPGHLEVLIRTTNEEGGGGGGEITCVVADQAMAWALGVAEKMGLRAAVFCPVSTGIMAITMSIPRLIDEGIIHPDGRPKKADGEFQLAAGMPAMNASHLGWNFLGDSEVQSIMYRYFQSNNKATASAEFVLCNSFLELERPTFAYAPHPHLLPVGPLLARHRRLRHRSELSVHFPREDPGWAAWLDGQKPRSVVYAAFGSTAIFSRRQFREFALGLELSGQAFLWVARPGLADGEGPALPEGFEERVSGRGMVVRWVPQQEVLAHPALACFISHCGWNSTMEGVANGVPFLCWPYFADQFLNRDYICGAWRTGLSVAPDGDGVVTREEIRDKLEALLGDEGIRERALQLREAAEKSVQEGGASSANLNRFVEAMKA